MSSDCYSRIFLLSHMRAFTSLLGHILGSHPAINGYFELHISYDNPAALDKQAGELCRYEPLKDSSRYLFDKLLHNDYRLMPALLAVNDATVLVSLREPAASIKSIVNLFARKASGDQYEQPKEAATYYIERVRRLTEFCASAAHPYYYLDAESIRTKPEQLLPALTRWLDLYPPLSPRYKTFSQTGKPRKGDSSALIRSGEIDQSASDYSHVYIEPDLLAKAVSTYRECRRNMIANAADCILLH
jgi:hypothetical protein